jgi:hypothetical protein
MVKGKTANKDPAKKRRGYLNSPLIEDRVFQRMTRNRKGTTAR